MSHWDKEAIYDEHFSPLVAKLIALAKEHQLPLVVQVQYCDTEENGPGFCTTTIPIKGITAEKMKRVIAAAQPDRHFAIRRNHRDGTRRVDALHEQVDPMKSGLSGGVDR